MTSSHKVEVGLRGPQQVINGRSLQIQLAAIGVGEDGKQVSDDWFVSYINERSPQDAIVLQKKGSKKPTRKYYERLEIDLDRVPEEVRSIAVAAYIFQAEYRGFSFLDVVHPRMDVNDLKLEIGLSLNLEEVLGDGGPANFDTVHFIDLRREGDNWKVSMVDNGVDLREFLRGYGAFQHI